MILAADYHDLAVVQKFSIKTRALGHFPVKRQTHPSWIRAHCLFTRGLQSSSSWGRVQEMPQLQTQCSQGAKGQKVKGHFLLKESSQIIVPFPTPNPNFLSRLWVLLVSEFARGTIYGINACELGALSSLRVTWVRGCPHSVTSELWASFNMCCSATKGPIVLEKQSVLLPGT